MEATKQESELIIQPPEVVIQKPEESDESPIELFHQQSADDVVHQNSLN